MKNNRLKIFISLFVGFMLLTMLTNCTSENSKNLGQENAIWTETVFFRGYYPSAPHITLTEDIIKRHAETLKKNNIKYTYLFAGPFDKDGYLPDHSFSETAINSVKLLKQYYPEIVILPWIGGKHYKTIFLDDSTWVKNALNDSKRLINTLSVPGLHFDFEFIIPGEPFLDRTEIPNGAGDIETYGDNVNDFHKQFRELMPDAFVSSVVVATSPGTKPWKRKTTMDELKVLTKYVDQLSFLYYDTYISDQAVFEENCVFLLKDIQTLRDNAPDVQYLVSIGTFINPIEFQKYRNMDIENIPNSLQTLRKSIHKVSRKKQIVDGISIFCNWTTDEDEWEEIYDNWTKFKK